ncbi:hypothetical protein AA313_de0209067 [Arthrobotrys entomopaga]|nr:hypothetical protein AA313_de0209067 [Arthrobotrys entomopaga]
MFAPRIIAGFSKRMATCGIRTTNRKLHGRMLKISEEVREAVATKKPVVALETTIYTHGYPHADCVELPLLLESIVRNNGGIPATIGIFDGQARVGLNDEELVELGSTAESGSALKVSRRDLAYICGQVRKLISGFPNGEFKNSDR